MPELFARALGAACSGPLRCFYCGAACDGGLTAAVHVKDSFTGQSEVAAPGSPAVCAGCVLCLREAADIPLIDGTTRYVSKCAMRAWSWIVTNDRVIAASKAHLRQLRNLCLQGPDGDGPWAIVLNDSGKKQLLYRGAVNQSRAEPWTVTLETERVTYRREQLKDRLALTTRLIAATGKPALAEPVSVRFALSVFDYFLDGESLVHEWSRVQDQPLSRLAAWLSPKKEDAQREYPREQPGPTPRPGSAGPARDGHGSVPPETRRPGRSRSDDGHDREDRDPRDRQPFLFDPGLQKISRKPTPFRGGMKACGLCCWRLANNTDTPTMPSWVKPIVARKPASS